MESLKYYFNSSYLEKKSHNNQKKLEIGVCSNLIKFKEHRVPDKSNPKKFIQRHIIKIKKKEDKEGIFTTARVKQLVMYKEALIWLCCAVLSWFSHVQLFATAWTVTCQPPLSMGFSRQY